MNEAGLNAKWLRADLTHPSARPSPRKCSTTCASACPTIRSSTATSTIWRPPRPSPPPTALPSTTWSSSPTSSPRRARRHAPYYTNSSHLPVGYTDDIFAALDVQDELQTLYTSGTVFHAFLGEKLPDWKAAANLVRKIAENYKLPYYTISPPIPSARTTAISPASSSPAPTAAKRPRYTAASPATTARCRTGTTARRQEWRAAPRIAAGKCLQYPGIRAERTVNKLFP
jgi:hypothetical protein